MFILKIGVVTLGLVLNVFGDMAGLHLGASDASEQIGALEFHR